jgi:hypothetical protein
VECSYRFNNSGVGMESAGTAPGAGCFCSSRQHRASSCQHRAASANVAFAAGSMADAARCS